MFCIGCVIFYCDREPHINDRELEYCPVKLDSVLDITNQIEYAYVYENGHLICEMQSEGAYIDDNGFKHSGALKRRTVYRYNTKGEVAEKTFYDADGSIADKYTYTDDSTRPSHSRPAQRPVPAVTSSADSNLTKY